MIFQIASGTRDEEELQGGKKEREMVKCPSRFLVTTSLGKVSSRFRWTGVTEYAMPCACVRASDEISDMNRAHTVRV